MSERYIAIETSSPQLALAAGDEARILASYRGPLAWRHADTLFEGMQKLLNRLRWKPSTLTGVAVSIGPGSFTGIRIGLAAARALGQSLKVPVVGISSLQTLAAGLPKARWVSPMIDALRGQVFTGLYERRASGDVRKGVKEVRVPIDLWLASLKRKKIKDLWITGDALQTYATPLKALRGVNWAAPADRYPRADVLLNLARKRLSKAHGNTYEHVVPLYLREAAPVERRRRRQK